MTDLAPEPPKGQVMNQSDFSGWLVYMNCHSGEVFLTMANETTESLIWKLSELKRNPPMIAAEILAVTFALHLHCL